MYDRDIRAELCREIRAVHANDRDTVLVEELGLCRGQVRVDLAVVNGALKGYEIKSPADTLRRLPTQAAIYGQVMDAMAIVLAEEHRTDAEALIPSWWEIIVAERDGERVQLRRVRDGAPNPTLDARAMSELLWADQAMELLRDRDAARGLSRAVRAEVWDRVAAVVAIDDLRAAVRQRLKERAARPPARTRV